MSGICTRKVGLQQAATGSFQCTFVLEPIDSDFGVDGITTDMIETIDGFIRDDLHTSQLHLRLATELAADEWKAMKAFGQLMTRVFAGSREISKSRREAETSQRRSLRMVCDNSPSLFQIEAMCSAIVRTQTLDELWLRFDVAPHVRDWWKWLGYAFFSKRARTSSTLRSITLTGIDSMTMEDIAVFALVFGSERPEEDLHGLLHEPVEGKDAVLKEHAPIRWKFDEDGQPCTQAKLLQIAAPISVQTYRDDGESTWTNAMVPGYGRCQVQRDDLDFGRDEAVESTQPGVTSLTIAFANCDDPDFSGLLLFLITIGPSLKELTLDISVLEIDPNHIIQCCSNLDILTLCVGKVDVQLNFTHFREKNEPVPTLNCQWFDIAALSRNVADNNNPLSKCVTRLRIRLLNHWDQDDLSQSLPPIDYQEDLTALLLMLETNQTLEYLDIIILQRNFGFLSKFQKHHLEPLNRVLGPFPQEGKVAFMSVLGFEINITESTKKRKGSKPRQPLCAASLDQHVVSRIFELAAPPVTRKVFFRLQSGSWGWRNEWLES